MTLECRGIDKALPREQALDMATMISASLRALSHELRYEPTTKHIRALLGGVPS